MSVSLAKVGNGPKLHVYVRPVKRTPNTAPPVRTADYADGYGGTYSKGE